MIPLRERTSSARWRYKKSPRPHSAVPDCHQYSANFEGSAHKLRAKPIVSLRLFWRLPLKLRYTRHRMQTWIMRTRSVVFRVVASAFVLFAVGAAGFAGPPPSDEPAHGILEVSFLFNKAEGIVPSYQIAIWLEREDGEYVKTLFVSDWLAGSGIGLEIVCPDWVKQSHWDKVEESEFDAATHPTPPVGSNTMKFDCRKRGILPGSYRFCVQAHITENYNILYRGTIRIGGESSESSAEAFYGPKKHPKAGDILYGVRARYLPDNSPNTIKEKP